MTEDFMLALGHWILDLARKWSNFKIAVIACTGIVIGTLPVILLGASSAVFLVSIEVAALLLVCSLYARFRAQRIDSLTLHGNNYLPSADLRSMAEALGIMAQAGRVSAMTIRQEIEPYQPPSDAHIAITESTGDWAHWGVSGIERPPGAQIAIHQIGTAEPIGWFDSVGNWLEPPLQGEYEEMLYAAADWRTK